MSYTPAMPAGIETRGLRVVFRLQLLLLVRYCRKTAKKLTYSAVLALNDVFCGGTALEWGRRSQPMNWAGMRMSAGASSASGLAPCRPAGTRGVVAEAPRPMLLQLLRRAARALCSSAIASRCAPAEWPNAVTWVTHVI